MAKRDVSFIINTYRYGKFYVEYPVSNKEIHLILDAIENSEDFEDCEDLGELYERVMNTAREKLEEDLDLDGGEIDLDELDYCIEFADEDEYQ